MTKREAIETLNEIGGYLDNCPKEDEIFKALSIAIDALDNCPPDDSVCYGCHDNCSKCEISDFAML